MTTNLLDQALEYLNEETSWVGVEDRALFLGFPCCLVSQTRSQLGKWVAKSVLERRKTESYCYGKLCLVNQYRVCPALDREIVSFYQK